MGKYEDFIDKDKGLAMSGTGIFTMFKLIAILDQSLHPITILLTHGDLFLLSRGIFY